MKWLAYALVGFGAIGLYARFSLAQANTAGSTGSVTQLANYDPALLLGIPPSATFPETGAFLDAALLGTGLYMLYT